MEVLTGVLGMHQQIKQRSWASWEARGRGLGKTMNKNKTKPRGQDGRPGGPDKAGGASDSGELLRSQVAVSAGYGTRQGLSAVGGKFQAGRPPAGVCPACRGPARRPAWRKGSEAPGAAGEAVRAAGRC